MPPYPLGSYSTVYVYKDGAVYQTFSGIIFNFVNLSSLSWLSEIPGIVHLLNHTAVGLAG